MPKFKKSFRILNRVKNPYDKNFEVHNFEEFKERWSMYQFTTNPFETEQEYNDYIHYETLPPSVTDRLKSYYGIEGNFDPNNVIYNIRRTVDAIQGGGYAATKASIYRKNLIKSLKNFSDIDNDFISTRDFGDISVRDVINVLKQMSLKEIDELSKDADIVPDFRVFGSKQEGVKDNNLLELGLWLTQVSRTSQFSILHKYMHREERQQVTFERTLPKEVKELIKQGKLTTPKQVRFERYWTLYKRGKLFDFDTRGNYIIRFAKKSEYDEILRYIDRRRKETNFD